MKPRIISQTLCGDEFKICYVHIGKQPWFVGKDIAASLGYSSPTNAITRYVDNDDKIVNRIPREYRDVIRRTKITLINDIAVWALVFRAKDKKKARRFKVWFRTIVLGMSKEIRNEKQLHHSVVKYIRRNIPWVLPLVIAGLGELQHTAKKRVESWKKRYQRGQPDLIINLPQNRKGYSSKGLAIEIKTPKGDGRLSNSQREILNAYEAIGYTCIVSNDLIEIIIGISDHIIGVKTARCDHCRKQLLVDTPLAQHECV